MNFIDKEHNIFFVNKLVELYKYRNPDVYNISLLYILGMCPVTRKNIKNIFNIEKGEINIDSINATWQTDTSSKVTRIAFSLWNGCMYDSEQDIENNKISSSYNLSEIFNCSYAPYFYEGIKLRYPEYTKEKTNFSTTEISQELVKNKYEYRESR